MKIYLIGQTIGMDNLNRPAFNSAAFALRERGISVVNLHELYDGLDVTKMNRREFMSVRIKALLECDSYIILHPARDLDAQLESDLAWNLDMNRLNLEDVLKSHSAKTNEHATNAVATSAA
jgi:hypothetical protein